MADQTFSLGNGATFNSQGVAQNTQAQTDLSSLGVQGNSYNSYVPPDTTQPVPSSSLTSNALNLPAPSQTADPAAFVNSLPGATATPQSSSTPNLDLAMTGDLTKDPGYAQALQQYQQSVQQYQDTASQAPSQANLLTQAQGQFNVSRNLQNVQDLNTQLAQLQANFNNASAATEAKGITSGTPAVFYQGEQAAIQRQQAVQAGALATQIQAAQGNYQMAESLAEKTSNLQFQDFQNKLDRINQFISLNQQNLSTAEKNAATKLQAQTVLLQQQLDQQKTLRTLALQIGVNKPFMNIGGTVYSTATGQAFSTPEQAASAGVDVKNWSNVQSVDPTKSSQKFSQVGTDQYGLPVYGFVDDAKGTVTPITPSTGSYQANGNGLTVNNPDPSKVINGYDFTNYATDPNWGNAVQNIMQKIPDIAVPPSGPPTPQTVQALTSYIQKVAPSSKITGQMILTAAQQYGIDPKVMTAILQQESQFGTAGLGAKTFNPGNVGNTDSGASKNYGDWQSGVNAVASNMANRVTTQLVSAHQATSNDPAVQQFLQNRTPEQQAAFLGLNPIEQSNVMQLINGDVLLSDLMSSRGMQGSKARQTILDQARKVDPTFSENTNKTRYAFRQDWVDANGKSFAKRDAINTGMGHLADLKSIVNRLSGNSDFMKANSIQQWISKQSNGKNAADVQLFGQTAEQLAHELATVYAGGTAPDEKSIQAQRDIINSIKPSDVLVKLINNDVTLLGSKLNSTATEYKNVMGNFPTDPIIHPDVLSELKNQGVDTKPLDQALQNQGYNNIPTGMVQVISPQGQTGYIPQEQLQTALSQGYKQ